MNITDFLDKYRVKYDASGHGKNRSGWVNVICPSCGRWPYMGINLTRMYATAWCCGYMNLYSLLSRLSGLHRESVKELIGELVSDTSRYSEPHTGTLKLPIGLDCLKRNELGYLRSRGFDPRELERIWDLRSIGLLGGRLAWRIFIPIYLDGEVVTYTTRKLNNTEPRYVSATDLHSAVPIERCLYGWDFVRCSCVVVEGPADAWRIGPGAVALLGLRTHSAQLERLSRLSSVAICFDNEPEAQARARNLMRNLNPLTRVSNIILDTGDDPGSADPREIKLLRERFL